ncbi:hypothetical protein CJU89_5314 [Yarrowia sp. B02]|nr:hypothetical protein CJU89_5314 [Yarrowia sp. B02]
MKLPNEILAQICASLDLESLLQLSYADSRLRAVATSLFQDHIQASWPWITGSSDWHKEGVKIVAARRIMCREHPESEEMPVVQVSEDLIHVNEPVPEEAVILGPETKYMDDDHDLYFRTGSLTRINARNMADPLSFHDPLCMDVGDFLQLTGTKNAHGKTIMTHTFMGRYWIFVYDEGEGVLEDPKLSTVDNWIYCYFRTEQGYTVIKHHCITDGVKDEPDFLISLPESAYGSNYQLDFFFSRENVFVIDKLGYGSEDDFKPVYFRLLNMETGTTIPLCFVDRSDTHVMEYEAFVDYLRYLWLDGPFFYIYSGADEMIITVDVNDGWVKYSVLTTEIFNESYLSRLTYGLLWLYDNLMQRGCVV